MRPPTNGHGHVAEADGYTRAAPSGRAVPGAAAVVPIAAAGVVDGVALVADDVDAVVDDDEIGVGVDVGHCGAGARSVGYGVGIAVDPSGAAREPQSKEADRHEDARPDEGVHSKTS